MEKNGFYTKIELFFLLFKLLPFELCIKYFFTKCASLPSPPLPPSLPPPVPKLLPKPSLLLPKPTLLLPKPTLLPTKANWTTMPPPGVFQHHNFFIK